MLDSRSLHRAMMDDHLCPGIRPLHTRHTTDRITSWLWDREGCPFERRSPCPSTPVSILCSVFPWHEEPSPQPPRLSPRREGERSEMHVRKKSAGTAECIPPILVLTWQSSSA